MKLFVILSFFITSLAYAEICSYEDNRVESNDKAVARATYRFDPTASSRARCTVTMISKTCFVTSGQCGKWAEYMEFNVPASINGKPQKSSSEDFYYIDPHSIRASGDNVATGQIGKHWGVGRALMNQETKLFPGEAQGFHPVISSRPSKNIDIKVVQYSSTNPNSYDVRTGRVSRNQDWDILNFSQSVSSGVLINAGTLLIPNIIEFNADTGAGSAGAPIINSETRELIGVNTHGGCQAAPNRSDLTNSGTSVYGNKDFRDAVNYCLSKEAGVIATRDIIYGTPENL